MHFRSFNQPSEEMLLKWSAYELFQIGCCIVVTFLAVFLFFFTMDLFKSEIKFELNGIVKLNSTVDTDIQFLQTKCIKSLDDGQQLLLKA